MKLELAIMAGEQSKQFLIDLTKLVERLEKIGLKGVEAKPSSDDSAGKYAGATAAPTKSAKAQTIEEDFLDDDDFAPKGEEDSFEDEDDGLQASSDETSEWDDSFSDDDIEAGEDDAPVAKPAKKETKAKKESAKAEKPAKTKAAKITQKEVNLAIVEKIKAVKKARNLTGEKARSIVLSNLSKKFGTTNVNEIEPKDYASVVKYMAV